MARLQNIILGLLGVGGAAYALHEWQRLHVGQQASELKLKIAGIAFQDGDIVISIKMLNPTSVDMSVKSFVGSMYANGHPVADIQMFGDYVARGNNQVTIPLIAKPRLQNLYLQFQQLMRTGGATILYNGTINVNDHPIPINLSYRK
jgi:LEA14-like dessication related protein